jgi:hypothetical protein
MNKIRFLRVDCQNSLVFYKKYTLGLSINQELVAPNKKAGKSKQSG